MKNSVVVALAGQPNCGKSTIFNMLTGARQHVANYPGVTVDIKKGKYRHDDTSFDVVDLPGTYSLTSYSSEEMVARDFILKNESQVVLNVVDSSNLRQGLYLTFQLLEMEAPLAMALNMTDVAKSKGSSVDPEALQKELGIPVVETVGNRNKGNVELKKVLSTYTPSEKGKSFSLDYGLLEPVIRELTKDLQALQEFVLPCRWGALKILEGDIAVIDIVKNLGEKGEKLIIKASSLGKDFEKEQDDPRAHIGLCRHLKAAEVEKQCVEDNTSGRVPFSDRIDAVVVNKIGGPIILLGLVYCLYELAIVKGYKATEYLVPWLNRAETLISGWLPAAGVLHEPLIRSLSLSIVASVKSVLIYVPIFLILFACIAALEDVGYMPRMAFILDRLFRRFGLHGQSTLPLILGGVFIGGCAVPGVMATRVIADEKARLATVLVVPLMNCMAKIPLYTLLITVFFGTHPGSMMVFISTISLIMGLGVAKVLTMTILRGKESSPFVMELPSYHRPTVRGIVTRSIERTWLFLRKVGTVVVSVSVIVYFLFSYPGLPTERQDFYQKQADELVATFRTKVAKTSYAPLFKDGNGMKRLIRYMELNKMARMAGQSPKSVEAKFKAMDGELFPLIDPANRKNKEVKAVGRAFKLFRKDRAFLLKAMKDERTNGSLLGQAGAALVPFTRYAGFDWKVNVALLSSLAAKESTVATLGMIYRPVDGGEEASLEKEIAKGGQTPLHALALIVFMVLYPPCVATLMMVKLETGSWGWAGFSLIYPIVLGILTASLIYSGGKALRLTGFEATWVFYGLALLVTLGLGFIKSPGERKLSARRRKEVRS